MKKTIRRSTQSPTGTSFFGNTVYATRAKLKSVLGTPTYTNRDTSEKSQYEWVLEIDGQVFTVYDWKEYRSVKAEEPIHWHIGANSIVISDWAQRELAQLTEK